MRGMPIDKQVGQGTAEPAQASYAEEGSFQET